ncbi:hypothetical protein AB1Y20_002191 [Prymnesium parvum]|uniref:Large ribosomal subunit protein uL3m n=1 Tax=Prymnesium parvum TaxID=97485 RepID=A0AB34JAA3_PRYPA
MKCGMTQAWTVWGEQIPLTVVELQDLQVVQVKTENVEGFNALQLGGGWQKRKRLSRAMLGHFSQRSISYKRYLREFMVTKDALLPVGTSITVRHFVPGQYVDVQGVSKGKGFQGVMKRWGFAGQPASHGVTRAHRKPGSSGGAAGSMYKTGIWPGKKMPGKMGNKNRTAFCLLVYKIDPEHNLIYLKGSVPGHHGSIVRLKDTVRGQKQLMGKRGLPHPPPFPTFLPGDPLPEQLVAPQPEGDPLRLDP